MASNVSSSGGFWSEDRSLSVFLATVVFVFFILTPLAHHRPALLFLLETLFALLLISGVSAVFRSGPWGLVAKLLSLSAWSVRQAEHFLPSLRLREVELALTCACMSLFVGVLLVRIFSGGESNNFRLQGAAAAYIMMAIAWGHLYALLEMLHPGCFHGPPGFLEADRLVPTLTFFSSITLTTVGYGDITPVHPFARSMVCLEAFCGVLYPAILVGRLVSLSLRPEPVPAEIFQGPPLESDS
jgi:hypothetical protein